MLEQLRGQKTLKLQTTFHLASTLLNSKITFQMLGRNFNLVMKVQSKFKIEIRLMLMLSYIIFGNVGFSRQY